MGRLRRRQKKKADGTDSFKRELIQSYRRFEQELRVLCDKHGVEINLWYSPSKIPQPRFVFDGDAFDADTLFHEEGWEFPAQPDGMGSRPDLSGRPTRIVHDELKALEEDLEQGPHKPQRLHQ